MQGSRGRTQMGLRNLDLRPFAPPGLASADKGRTRSANVPPMLCMGDLAERGLALFRQPPSLLQGGGAP
jgi:hypothetical protein